MALNQPRKKFRASELPLEASQRSAIDGLVRNIKKRGEFDTLRKQVWAEYTESVRPLTSQSQLKIGSS